MEQAQQWVDQGRTQLPHAPEYYESLLEGPFCSTGWNAQDILRPTGSEILLETAILPRVIPAAHE